MLAMEMPKIDSFWDEQLVNQAHAHRHGPPAVQQAVVGSGGTQSPYERNLNFATVAVEDGEYGFPKKKTVRDPLSHRIIEKRRRDRMNNCLADLARLLPPSSLRKGRGRIEKTEIVELAIKHLRHLQCHPCPLGEKCEFSGSSSAENAGGGGHNNSPPASCSSSSTSSGYQSSHEEQFRLGFQECLSEAMHFLVEQEGLYAGDAMCVRLVKHLNSHCDVLLRDHWGNQGKIVPGFRRAAESAKTSGGSSSSGYHPNGSSSGSDGNGGNDGEGTEPFVLPIQNPPNNLTVEGSRNSSILDYEAENSCSSTPLSIETSDVLSCDGKNTSRSSSKPPIPSIICSHSSTNSRIPVNSGSPANGSTNGRSSDDGSANSSTSSAHRYKFKSNIKQRFTADCQTKSDDGYIPGSGGKPGAENDGDGVSDGEDIRDERISGIEESMLHPSQAGGQSCDEDGEMKQGSSSRRGSMSQHTGGAASNKSTQQISAVGASLLDKTGCNNSTLNNSVEVDLKSSLTPSSSPMDLQNQRGREATEMKPSPEELLSAIHNLSSPNINGSSNKSHLPFQMNGENNSGLEEKGVPAFALHEKGLFYVPLTIDKSLVTNVVNRIDTSATPPLYPVTISVCFLLKPDKKAKLDGMQSEVDIAVPNSSEKQADFVQASTPIPLPLIPSGGSSSGSPMKSSRRGHRESSNFFSGRYNHQRQTSSSKDSSSHHSRVSSSNSSTIGFGYQIIPSHSSSPNSGGGFEVIHSGNSNAIGSSMINNPLPGGGGSSYHANFPEQNNGSSNEINRQPGGHDRENESNSICVRNTGGGSSSSSSGVGGSSGGRSGRKRSVSSSPSVAGSGASVGSLGYHSWHEKGSPSSPDFFSFHHANTHALQQAMVAAHSHHLTTGPPPPGGMSPMGPKYGQAMSTFHSAESVMREKEACFGHDKRKKARSVDQSMEAKQN